MSVRYGLMGVLLAASNIVFSQEAKDQQLKLVNLKISDQLIAISNDSIVKDSIKNSIKLKNGPILVLDSTSSSEKIFLFRKDGMKNMDKRKLDRDVIKFNYDTNGERLEVRQLNDNTDLLIRNEIIYQFIDTIDHLVIQNYFDNNLRISNWIADPYVPNRYLVKLAVFKGATTLDSIVNIIHPLIEFIEPNIGIVSSSSVLNKPFSSTDQFDAKPSEWPNDEFLKFQWYLRSPRSPTELNEEMDIVNSWEVYSGKNILIAILDNGVETSHSELQNKIMRFYNAFSNDTLSYPSTMEYHGTACAGLAVAMKGNGRGICGVAPDARLLNIKIAETPADDIWNTSPAILSRGIIWAADNGAKIINCSWGSERRSRSIIKAIKYATNKGCIMVCAAGNTGKGIEFPASLSDEIDGVISVGASNNSGQFKTFRSDDGEPWASCYGESLTIVAPGVSLVTTDLMADRGKSTNSDYLNFSGTSASCPIVSGTIALMLSKNSNLSAKDIKVFISRFSDEIIFDNRFVFKKLNIVRLLDGVTD